MSDYEKMHDQCKESLRRQWLEHTAHGKLYCALSVYQIADIERYNRVICRLLGRREDYLEDHWDEEWEEMWDSAAEAADPYGYRGLSRGDF